MYQIWLPWWLSSKESTCQAGDAGSIPGSRRFPGGGNGKPTPVFLLGESHGQKSLVGYSPRGHKRDGHDLVPKQQQSQRIYSTPSRVNTGTSLVAQTVESFHLQCKQSAKMVFQTYQYQYVQQPLQQLHLEKPLSSQRDTDYKQQL